MANIATCPKCAKQLGLPATISMTDQVECPECQAVFSLSETIQIALPVARLLTTTEQPAVVSSSETPMTGDTSLPQEGDTELLKDHSKPSTNDAPSEKSWEERLKNALALGDSTAAPSETPDDESNVERKIEYDIDHNLENDLEPNIDESPIPSAKQAAVSPSPSFDFQLDPPSETPSTSKKLQLEMPSFASRFSQNVSTTSVPVNASPKTLADFAAAAIRPATDDLEPTSPQPSAFSTRAEEGAEESRDKESFISVVNNLTTESSLAPAASPVKEKETSHQTDVSTNKVLRHRRTRRVSPRVAGMAVGPIAGSLLGLYGLLWFQGAKADYLGLAKVLPAAILPTDFCESSQASLLANTNSTEAKSKEKFSASLMAAQDLMQRDSEVMPASATLPIAETPARQQISANKFSALVDDAQAALPEILTGSLSGKSSVRRKGQAYMTLCRLAEHFHFAQQPALAPVWQRKARQAELLFQQAAADAEARRDLSLITSQWWEYNPRPNNGIFFTGQIQKTQLATGGTLCWVKMDEQSTVAIPVLMKHKHFQQGDQIGVVGRVVASYDDIPAGLSARQVVAAEHSFVL